MQLQVKFIAIGLVAVVLAIECVAAVITVQIGGTSRLTTSLSRSRDRYKCHWDCDLVSCQIDHDDDECAYECEKVCRIRYDDFAVGRSGVAQSIGADGGELRPKSGNLDEAAKEAVTLLGAGTSVTLHLPRNATAKSFAIMDNCAQFN